MKIYAVKICLDEEKVTQSLEGKEGGCVWEELREGGWI